MMWVKRRDGTKVQRNQILGRVLGGNLRLHNSSKRVQTSPGASSFPYEE